MDLTFRVATKDDIPAIRDIARDSGLPEPSDYSDEYMGKLFDQKLANILALVDGHPVGYILSGFLRPTRTDISHYYTYTKNKDGKDVEPFILTIVSFAVRKPFQDQGIGSLLLQQALFQYDPKYHIILHTRANSRCRFLYERNGFIPVGVIPRYYIRGKEFEEKTSEEKKETPAKETPEEKKVNPNIIIEDSGVVEAYSGPPVVFEFDFLDPKGHPSDAVTMVRMGELTDPWVQKDRQRYLAQRDGLDLELSRALELSRLEM